MKKIFVFFLITSCSYPQINNMKSQDFFDFNMNLSFDEFNTLLIKYVEKSPYPNINE